MVCLIIALAVRRRGMPYLCRVIYRRMLLIYFAIVLSREVIKLPSQVGRAVISKALHNIGGTLNSHLHTGFTLCS